MDQNKRRMLMKAFINSHFPYCPLVWMFHRRNTEQRVNKIHDIASRLAQSKKLLRNNISQFCDFLASSQKFETAKYLSWWHS